MWLRNNAFQKKDWIPALFLLFFICVTNVGAEENAPSYIPAEKPLICAEDQYLMFQGANSSIYDVYDAWGNHLFEKNGYTQLFCPMILSEDSIVLGSSHENTPQITVMSPKAKGAVMVLSSQEYDVRSKIHWFQVTERDSGVSVVYDSSGQPVGSPTEDLSESSPVLSTFEGSYFFPMENGYLYGVRYENQSSWVYAAGDGSDSFVINPYNPLMKVLSTIPYEQMYTIGNYIVDGRGFQEKNGTVYSLSGEKVLNHVCGVSVIPYDTKGWMYDYDSITRQGYSYHMTETDYLFCQEGEKYGVYDKNLNRIGAVDLNQDNPFPVQALNGTIQGLPSEALGGALCEGFLIDGKRHFRAYAKEGTNWIIESEAGPILLEISEKEEIVTINDNYCKTVEKGTQNMNRIYHRVSGQPARLMLEYSQDSVVTELTSDGLLVTTKVPVDHGSYTSWETVSNVIHGPDGSITCQLGKAYVRVLAEGIIYVGQGIYKGIINSEGTWLFKRIDPGLME